jgi:hypothetical protein
MLRGGVPGNRRADVLAGLVDAGLRGAATKTPVGKLPIPLTLGVISVTIETFEPVEPDPDGSSTDERAHP